jgi:23S rRNA pseudouridine1911/1915/1917 synthase
MNPVIKLSSAATNEFWEIPILFEDEHLLALDKPAGLLTSPDRYDPQRPSLINLLHAGIAQDKSWARQRGLTYLINAHRPDFETTGVLLLAKSKVILIALANLFSAGKADRTYVTLVHGSPGQGRFEVAARLAPHPVRPGVMRVDEKRGKRSQTVFEVLEQFSGYTLMKCRLLTERAHQIRVHLRRTGLPVVGDALYGGSPLLLSRLKSGYRLKPDRVERPLISNAVLHAEQFSLPHPITGATVTVAAPWPRDLNVAVKYLRRYAAAG